MQALPILPKLAANVGPLRCVFNANQTGPPLNIYRQTPLLIRSTSARLGLVAALPLKQFQLIKFVGSDQHSVLNGDKLHTCYFLIRGSSLKKQGKKNNFLFPSIKYWIKASEGPFPVITSLLQ